MRLSENPTPALAGAEPGPSGRRIHVLHPVHGFSAGGMERQLAHVLSRMPAHRFRHTLLVRAPAATRLPAPHGVDLVEDASRGPDRRWSRVLAAQARRCSAALIHARNFAMLPDAAAAARQTGCGLVFSFHGLESCDWSPSWLRARMLRAAARTSLVRWAVSGAAAVRAAEVLGLRRAAFRIIRNGVDVDHFAPAADRAAVRHALGLPADRVVFLAVGRNVEIKGFARLIEAYRRSGIAAAAMLVVVGEGAESLTVPSACSRMLRLVGAQSDMARWYQAADVFVLASAWEGLPNALLEAMATGLAVIAPAVGGVPEVVEHDLSGWLLDSGEPAELALALRAVAADPLTRSRLGAGARRRVTEAFSLSAAVEATARAYQRAWRRWTASIDPSRREAAVHVA